MCGCCPREHLRVCSGPFVYLFPLPSLLLVSGQTRWTFLRRTQLWTWSELIRNTALLVSPVSPSPDDKGPHKHCGWSPWHCASWKDSFSTKGGHLKRKFVTQKVDFSFHRRPLQKTIADQNSECGSQSQLVFLQHNSWILGSGFRNHCERWGGGKDCKNQKIRECDVRLCLLTTSEKLQLGDLPSPANCTWLLNFLTLTSLEIYCPSVGAWYQHYVEQGASGTMAEV